MHKYIKLCELIRKQKQNYYSCLSSIFAKFFGSDIPKLQFKYSV